MKQYVPLFEDFDELPDEFADLPIDEPTHKRMYPESDEPYREIALSLLRRNLNNVVRYINDAIHDHDSNFQFNLNYTELPDKELRFIYNLYLVGYTSPVFRSISVGYMDGPYYKETMYWDDKTIRTAALKQLEPARI